MPFTEHIRELLAGRHPSDANSLHVWNELQRMVRQQLRARGLAGLPPGYLGIVGAAWNEDTLTELVSECYNRAILMRIPRFAGSLRNFRVLTPLIRGNVGRALSDLQRHNDPVGYNIRANIRAVVREALTDGLLRATPERQHLPVTTRLRFAQADPSTPLVDEPGIAGLLARQTELLKTLAHLSRCGRRGRVWVAAFLDRFPPAGLLAFLLGTLTNVLVENGRAARTRADAPPADVAALEGDEDRELVRLVCQTYTLDEDEAWEHLCEWVEAAIDGLPARESTRAHLRCLFAVIIERVESGEVPRPGDTAPATGLSRQRVYELFACLAEILKRYPGFSSKPDK